MPKNDLEALNNHFFHLLENLTNPEEGTDMNLEIEKAKAAALLGKQIVEGAKVKVAYCKATKQELTDEFFGSNKSDLTLLENPTQKEINKKLDN